ncbi:hypothetical protein PYW08_011711 [Mythimna loreyi]|uniref:Uncharacterized protein n=1 Tax=Mythimna loreyi TaxID=667449 RepID=A0ACC2QK93_9NEOP|nr:hypothetical protein PYW08_011711 [Mythimna loreyi]
MKLTSSASEQNLFINYVCLVNEIKQSGTLSPNVGPNEKTSLSVMDVSAILNDDNIPEDHPIQVERSKAVHELAESYKKAELDEKCGEQSTPYSSQYPTTTSGEDSDTSENDENNFLPCDNPNVLKLTKMKWLTEDPDDGPDSSLPSMSSSNCSLASESELQEQNDFEDKYLSTILRLDKEHNLFGLSNIAIVGSRPSKAKRKDDEKAVFHQTAIVQVCCSRYCCRHKSNTDLPASLKCGGSCRGCCINASCTSCATACDLPPICLDDPPSCARVSSTCCRSGIAPCKCSACCPPHKCGADCSKCYGLKIKLNRKPVFEEPRVELTPRASCVLQKPISARTCYHNPRCIPPSSWFPYLMPCYWPARPSAPCTAPTRCFHNPPCLPARKPTRVPVPTQYICSRKCEDAAKHTKCQNEICPAHNPSLRKALEKRFNPRSHSCCNCPCDTADPQKSIEDIDTKILLKVKKKKKKKRSISCECFRPGCATCFVFRPEKRAENSNMRERNQ